MRFNFEKKIFLCSLIGLSGATILSASNVSVMIIESGKGAIGARDIAELWEDKIMNAFFSEGHIVSNARAKRIAHESGNEIPEEALRDLQSASEGGVEYFILALLNYKDALINSRANPEIISLRLYKVSPYSMLFEESVAQGAKVTHEDAINNARHAVKIINSYMRRGM